MLQLVKYAFDIPNTTENYFSYKFLLKNILPSYLQTESVRRNRRLVPFQVAYLVLQLSCLTYGDTVIVLAVSCPDLPTVHTVVYSIHIRDPSQDVVVSFAYRSDGSTEVLDIVLSHNILLLLLLTCFKSSFTLVYHYTKGRFQKNIVVEKKLEKCSNWSET